MIPDLNHYSQKYYSLVSKFFYFICILLCFSLVRNSPTFTLIGTVGALSAIAFAISYTVSRDQSSYWFYVFRSLKIFQEKLGSYYIENHDPEHWKNKLARNPLYAAIFVTILVAIFTTIFYLLFPADYMLYGVIALGFFFLPYSLSRLYTIAIPYHIINSFHFLINKEHDFDKVTKKKKSIRKILLEDLLILLTVNLFLVLPIADKAAFSLNPGYKPLWFFAAMSILMVIVCIFTLIPANSSRKYSFIGELYTGEISSSELTEEPSLAQSKYNKWTRYGFYLMLAAALPFAVCPLISAQINNSTFTIHYLICFAPIIYIYYIERYKVLYDELCFAQEVKGELDQYGDLIDTLLSSVEDADETKNEKAIESAVTVQ